MPSLRFAGLCGLVAVFTFTAGMVAGDLAQPAAFSPANDDISDLGALTASGPWLYNQVAANVSGLLLITLGLGLWVALSSSRLGRVGAATMIVAGLGTFLDGIFRLDCQGIDAGCTNDSWHAHAHKIESGITAAATLLTLVLLAFAFRRMAKWRNSWLPVLAAIPALFVANLAFSPIGPGAASRAGTVTVLGFIAFVGFRLFQTAE